MSPVTAADSIDLPASIAHLEGTTDPDVWARVASWASQPGVWRRDHPGGHFTAGALVFDPDRGLMACVDHPKFGRWMQPGGHIEAADASLAHAAAREVDEELGLVLDPLAGQVVAVAIFDDIPCPKGTLGVHCDIRVLWRHPVAELQCSDESLGVDWLPVSRLDEYGDHDLVALGRLLEGLGS